MRSSTDDKITFTQTRPDGSSLTYECEANHISWPELLLDFTYFLRGCGYYLNGEFEFTPDEDSIAGLQRINAELRDQIAGLEGEIEFRDEEEDDEDVEYADTTGTRTLG